jgi:hypothetical protein
MRRTIEADLAVLNKHEGWSNGREMMVLGFPLLLYCA